MVNEKEETETSISKWISAKQQPQKANRRSKNSFIYKYHSPEWYCLKEHSRISSVAFYHKKKGSLVNESNLNNKQTK